MKIAMPFAGLLKPRLPAIALFAALFVSSGAFADEVKSEFFHFDCKTKGIAASVRASEIQFIIRSTDELNFCTQTHSFSVKFDEGNDGINQVTVAALVMNAIIDKKDFRLTESTILIMSSKDTNQELREYAASQFHGATYGGMFHPSDLKITTIQAHD